MASIEALECLQSGEDSWNTYCQGADGIIDLTFADLNGFDLRNLNFSRCDLSAAQLVGANLDGASFTEVNLTGTQLVNASLINCHLTSVVANHINLSNAIIRNTTFSAISINNADATSTTLENCEFHRTTITNSSFNNAHLLVLSFKEVVIGDLEAVGLKLYRCKFWDSELRGWNIQNSSFIECVFRNGVISRLELTGSLIIDSAVVHSELNKSEFVSSEVKGLDLSSSVVREIEVAALNPASAVMLNTAFISCTWPKQAGQVTLSGKYIPSQHLLAQPVQDVFGVSPTLRREIGDAQYLVKRISEAQGLTQRIFFRVWGATTSFGQSLGRLTVFSIMVVILHALALLVASGDISSCQHLDLELILSTIGNVTKVFLGFGEAVASVDSFWENTIFWSVRIAGILSLGLWITIASSQLNKLSSF